MPPRSRRTPPKPAAKKPPVRTAPGKPSQKVKPKATSSAKPTPRGAPVGKTARTTQKPHVETVSVLPLPTLEPGQKAKTRTTTRERAILPVKLKENERITGIPKRDKDGNLTTRWRRSIRTPRKPRTGDKSALFKPKSVVPPGEPVSAPTPVPAAPRSETTNVTHTTNVTIFQVRRRKKTGAPSNPPASPPNTPAPTPEGLRFPSLVNRTGRRIPESKKPLRGGRKQLEEAIRARNQLRRTPQNAGATLPLLRNEEKQGQIERTIVEANERLNELRTQRDRAIAGQKDVRNYIFGTRFLSWIAWRKDIQKYNALIEKNEQTVRDLTRNAEELKAQYRILTNGIQNKGVEKRARTIVTLRQATSNFMNAIPDIHRGFSRRMGVVGKNARAIQQMKTYDPQIDARVEKIQRTIPQLRSARQIMVFETYFRMMIGALRKGKYREAAGWMIEMSRLA